MAVLLSRVVRARLTELGRSTEQLIAASELARSTVYSFLNDTRNPQGHTLRKLAAGLDWTAAELQSRLDGTPLVSPVADEQIARIVELLPSIPKERLDAIEQHVTLAVQPLNRGRANGPRDGEGNRPRATRNKHGQHPAHGEDSGNNPGITVTYNGAVPPTSRSMLQAITDVVQRLVNRDDFQGQLAPAGA